MLARLAFFVLPGFAIHAQSIEVRSEFQRFDPFGGIVAVDRVDNPREILSPVAVRNAHTSFHIAVRMAPGEPAFLYVQQNPADTLKIRVYKETFENTPLERGQRRLVERGHASTVAS